MVRTKLKKQHLEKEKFSKRDKENLAVISDILKKEKIYDQEYEEKSDALQSTLALIQELLAKKESLNKKYPDGELLLNDMILPQVHNLLLKAESQFKE